MKHPYLWKLIQEHIQNLVKHPIFGKISILDVWHDSEFPCKPRKDLREKHHLICLTGS